MKKLAALLLAVVMVFCLVACGDANNGGNVQNTDNQGTSTPNTDVSANPGQTTDGKTKITVGLANSFTTVDPFQGAGLYKNYVLNQVYLRLCQRDNFSTQKVTNIVMKDYEKVDDFTYNITIYEGIYDQAGNSITASDVAFCFNFCKENARSSASYIDHAEATGDYTLTLVLTDSGLGVFEMVCENIAVVSQAAYEASPDGMATQGIVGTGPYKIVEFIAGSRVVMEKVEDFWANNVDVEDSPIFAQNADVIQFDFLTEPVQMQAALETDSVQLGLWINEAIYEDVSAIDGLTVESLPSTQMCCVVFNQSADSPCQDINLRKAIATCINNELVIDNVLYGVGETAKYFGKAGTLGNNEDWANEYDNYPYDVDKAKEYLAASSYNGEDLAIIIMGNSTFRTASQVLQANMQAIGINCHIDEYDMSTWNKYLVASTGHYYDVSLQNYSTQGPYLIQTISTWVDGSRYTDGCTVNGINSEELQAAVDACKSNDWTQADYDAIEKYVQENCSVYQWYENKFTYACNDSLVITDADRGGVNGELIIGAIELPADWGYFA